MEAQLKNDGSKGRICAYCGGYGFTNSITGVTLGCHRCDQTGIEPESLADLKQQVDELTKLVKKLLGEN